MFVEYSAHDGRSGFLGIEVKYHEDLGGSSADHRARYDEIAAHMGCFRSAGQQELQRQPCQQIWRDHLLAGSMVAAGGYAHGTFVFLYPHENEKCRAGVERYRSLLSDESSFVAWELERVVEVLRERGAGSWVEELATRYLG